MTLAGGATLPSGQTETINGSVTDFNGSTGTSGQVATPGAGGQFVWAAPSVSSVFGRTGAVTAVSGDYTLNQIGNPTASTSFTYPSNDNAVETFAGTGIKQIVFPSGLIYNFSDDGSGESSAFVPWLGNQTVNSDIIVGLGSLGVGTEGIADSGVPVGTIAKMNAANVFSSTNEFVGLGTPVNLTGQTAALSDTTIFTPTIAGLYTVNIYAAESGTACTVWWNPHAAIDLDG